MLFPGYVLLQYQTKIIFKTFAIILGSICLTVWGHEKFFRRDYTYIDEYDSFYKLHSADPSSWEEAFLKCDDEGAKLFYPDDKEEWRVAANISESLTDVDGIFIGVRDEFGRGDFLTIDDFFKKSVRNQDSSDSKCVVMSLQTGSNSIGSCKHRRAFICKKFNNEICPTADSGYIYSKETNKCFKVNERQKTWDEAMHTCYMEGAILSTSIQEVNLNYLQRFIDSNEDYFIGVRRIFPGQEFYTTQGSKIFIPGENAFNCAIIRLSVNDNNYNNRYPITVQSGDCNNTLPFICEMSLNM